MSIAQLLPNASNRNLYVSGASHHGIGTGIMMLRMPHQSELIQCSMQLLSSLASASVGVNHATRGQLLAS